MVVSAGPGFAQTGKQADPAPLKGPADPGTAQGTVIKPNTTIDPGIKAPMPSSARFPTPIVKPPAVRTPAPPTQGPQG